MEAAETFSISGMPMRIAFSTSLALRAYRGKVVALVLIDTNSSYCQELTTNVFNVLALDLPRRNPGSLPI
jgi:hypothetical protein